MPSNTQISALDAYNEAISNLERSNEPMSLDDIRQIGIKAALQAALAGHVVVPLEPTVEQMEAAGKDVAEYIQKMIDAGGDVDATDYTLRAVAYRAMISAAPAQREG